MSNATPPPTKPAPTPEQEVRDIVSAPWFVHDVLVYGGTYLTLWADNAPAGGGWDAAIAVAPVALSALVRILLGKTE